MGNNKEIRQRMETYRTILLVLNWIGAVAIFIVGIVLVNSRLTQGIGIGVIIGSVVLGIIGHFLVNVALAIPFILLNNGDILESIKKGDVAAKPIEEIKETQNVKGELSLYKNPNLNSNILLKLSDGEEVIIIEKGEKLSFVDDYWIKIQCQNGSIGWCYLSGLEKKSKTIA